MHLVDEGEGEGSYCLPLRKFAAVPEPLSLFLPASPDAATESDATAAVDREGWKRRGTTTITASSSSTGDSSRSPLLSFEKPHSFPFHSIPFRTGRTERIEERDLDKITLFQAITWGYLSLTRSSLCVCLCVRVSIASGSSPSASKSHSLVHPASPLPVSLLLLSLFSSHAQSTRAVSFHLIFLPP